MAGRVLPQLEVMRVSALPTPASSYTGQYRRTTAGLFWSDGARWLQLDGTSGVDPWDYVFLGSNFSNSTTTLTAVTGFAFFGAANTTYEVEIFGLFQTAVTTTGMGMALDVPSGTAYGLAMHHATTAGSLTTSEQIADNAVLGNGSTGVRTNATNTPLTGRFVAAIGSTAGTVQVMLRSEVASSAVTLQAGMILKYRKAQNVSTQGRIYPITQANYDALSVKDANTLYVIVSAPVTAPSWKWIACTAAEYAAIGTKDPETLYVVKD